MVFSEATLAVPLIAGYAYHKQAHAGRGGKNFAKIYNEVEETVVVGQ
jgi:deoxyhypusine synthase